MSIYLIDYENTKNLSGLDKLTSDDIVMIFYSKNANSLTFESHKNILESSAKFEYFYASSGGKNALDFQLSTYIGYLINQNNDTKLYIVSKDQGFNFVVDFWKEQKNITINLITDLSGKTQSEEKDNLSSKIKDALMQGKFAEKDINIILNTIAQFKTKQAINNNLQKHFKDNTTVGKINKIIKPFLKDKK